MAIEKNKAFRNRKILDLCHRMNECTLQIPGCIGYSMDGLEPCHSNWQEEGIGIGIKADDIVAAGCHNCHMELDDRANLSREEKVWYWRRGAIRTVRHWLRQGWLKLAG